MVIFSYQLLVKDNKGKLTLFFQVLYFNLNIQIKEK